MGNVYGGINGINTEDATAAAGDILLGKTAYVKKVKITGTIPSKAGASITPGTSNQIIAAGQYLSGDQVIAGDSDLIPANIKAGVNIFGVTGDSNVVDTSPGDAATGEILSGKKAFVDGAQITGTYKPTLYSLPITSGDENVTGTTYAYLAKSVTIAYSGTYTFYFTGFAAGYDANLILNKNGSAVSGSEGTILANDLSKCVYSMACNAGDVITLYGKSTNTAGVVHAGSLLAVGQ